MKIFLFERYTLKCGSLKLFKTFNRNERQQKAQEYHSNYDLCDQVLSRPMLKTVATQTAPKISTHAPVAERPASEMNNTPGNVIVVPNATRNSAQQLIDNITSNMEFGGTLIYIQPSASTSAAPSNINVNGTTHPNSPISSQNNSHSEQKCISMTSDITPIYQFQNEDIDKIPSTTSAICKNQLQMCNNSQVSSTLIFNHTLNNILPTPIVNQFIQCLRFYLHFINLHCDCFVSN